MWLKHKQSIIVYTSVVVKQFIWKFRCLQKYKKLNVFKHISLNNKKHSLNYFKHFHKKKNICHKIIYKVTREHSPCDPTLYLYKFYVYIYMLFSSFPTLDTPLCKNILCSTITWKSKIIIIVGQNYVISHAKLTSASVYVIYLFSQNFLSSLNLCSNVNINFYFSVVFFSFKTVQRD